MNCLVFAYPRHFLVSVEAIKRVRRLLRCDQITVIWDDLHDQSQPVDQVRAQYALALGWDIAVIPHSRWPVDKSTSGWLRQQWIKLQLDQVFSDSAWIIMDGDCWLASPVALTLGQAHRATEYYEPYWQWAATLGLRWPGHSRIHALNIFERSVLASFHRAYPRIYQDFELWNRQHNTQGLVPGFSEFELYYSHAEQRMGRRYRNIPTILREYTSPTQFLSCCDSQHSVLHGCDQDLLALGWRPTGP